MSTTVGQWIDLPTAGGADDRVVADAPGGSGILAILASNATLAARQNGLRTVWEDAGSTLVWVDLLTSGDPSTVSWELEDSAGVYVRCAGTYRVRLYGELVTVPRLHLAARVEAPATHTAGIVLVAMTSFEGPRGGTLFASDTTTSTSPTALSCGLALAAEDLGSAPYSIGDAPPAERGEQTEVTVWVGAWCTSGSSLAKAALYGVTLSVIEP